MANCLKMATIQAILTLKKRGWSNRRIGRELGVRRETVSRYIRLAQEGSASGQASDMSSSTGPDPEVGNPKPDSNAPPGFSTADQVSEADGSKPATNAPAGAGWLNPADNAPSGWWEEEPDQAAKPPGCASQCEPFREIIKGKLDKDLAAQRIHQDLVAEYGFAGSYYSVRRFVRRLGKTHPLPFRRMESAPGDQGQVDFGAGGNIITADGKRRKSHVLRIILSNSRKGYSESVFRQTTEDFIGCLENAFWHFGGTPKTLIIDNLKAAVSQADWFDPELNPRLQSFCQHYGTVILPTKPYTPRHKGKIENGIGYVQDNALKGRTFSNLAEQNRHLLHWETHIADTRIHGTTRKQVGKVFEEVERPALLPLPMCRFAYFHEAKRAVHRDGHIEVDKSYYSVPPEYLGREVWARWDRHLVRIFDSKMEPITLHTKAEPGEFRTKPEHIHPHKISGIERGATWLLRKVSVVGPHTAQWAQEMLANRGIRGIRVLQGMLSLMNRHPYPDIEQACQIALTHQAFRLRTLRKLIAQGGPKQEQFEFIDEHPTIRPLKDYAEFVQKCLTGNQGA